MSPTPHQAAIAHLPNFVTAPGSTDGLFVFVTIMLLGSVLAVGVTFLWLHTLPERIAHKSEKLQFEIVAVLGLLALFTHIHLFWVAGLILALIELPDFLSPMRRIATAAEALAGIKPPQEIAPDEPDPFGHVAKSETALPAAPPAAAPATKAEG